MMTILNLMLDLNSEPQSHSSNVSVCMQEVQLTSHFLLVAAVSANPLRPGLHPVRLRTPLCYLRALLIAASQGLLLPTASTLGLLLLALVQRLLQVTLCLRLLLMALTLGLLLPLALMLGRLLPLVLMLGRLLLLAPGQLQTLTLKGRTSAKQSFRQTNSQPDWRPAC